MQKFAWMIPVCGLLLTGTVSADEIVKPHTFTAGTPASAEQVNADFDTVYSQVNKVGAAITVDGANNVGIGVAAPTARLDVGANQPTDVYSAWTGYDPAAQPCPHCTDTCDGEVTAEFTCPDGQSLQCEDLRNPGFTPQFRLVECDKSQLAAGFSGHVKMTGGTLTVAALAMPDGAADGAVLTADAAGAAAWRPLPEFAPTTHTHSDLAGLNLTGNLTLPTTNPAIMSGASRLLSSGSGGNFFSGLNSGNLTMTGTSNTAVGGSALAANTTGTYNTGSGQEALNRNTTGDQNTASGYRALVINTSGGANTAAGYMSLYANSTGNGNTATGAGALQSNSSGMQNTALGAYAGLTENGVNANISGNFNTFVGTQSGPGSTTQLSNATAIGYRAHVSQSNSLVLGGTGAQAVKVGIGTQTPSQALEVIGTVKADSFSGDGAGLANVDAAKVGGLGVSDLAPKATTYTRAEVDAIIQALNAQIYSSIRFSGKAWATASLVESAAPTANGTPAIAVDGAGNFLAVWSQHDGVSRYNMMANRYDSATESWGASPVLIENDNGGNASFPQVAMDAGGNGIAVWQQSDGVHTNILANRYEAATGLWGATAQLLETDDSGDAESPQIALDGSGNAIVVWAQFDGTRLNVWSNRYLAASNSWSGARLSEKDDAGDADSPQIVVDASGNALAVWNQSDGTYWHIWASRYLAALDGWDTPRLIETEAEHAVSPRIARDGSGNVLAVWMQVGSGMWNLMASRYDATTDSWVVPQLIESDNAGSTLDPRVAMDVAGNGVAIWAQSDGTRYNVWANRYTAGGWGTAQLLETDNSGTAVEPQIAVDNSGNAIAVWSQSDGTRKNIWANKFTLGIWGSPQLLESDNVGDALNPQLAMAGSGNAMGVWRQFNSSSRYDIWANRYK